LKLKRNNLDELQRVLARIRNEKFPDIPLDVVNDIVVAQYNNMSENDRLSARTRTTQIIMQFLNDSAIKD